MRNYEEYLNETSLGEDNIRFAVWCNFYVMMNGMDEDSPFSDDDMDLIESDEFKTFLGLSEDIFFDADEQCEELLESEEIYDSFQFYDDYAELIREPEFETEAQEITENIFQKYPQLNK